MTITGGANLVPTNSNADTGIQINGREPVSYDVTRPIGNVVFDNVTVTGSYAKVLVYIQGYTDLDGLSFLDSGTTISGHAGWGWALAIDPTADETSAATPGVPGEPGFFDDAAAGALAPNTVDLTHVSVANDNPVNVGAGHPLFAFNGTALGTVFSGTPVADDVTGTSGVGGNDILDGGEGIDTAVFSGTLSSAATIGISGGHWTVTVGGETDTLSGVEKLVFADKTVLLVDKSGANIGGFQSVQTAIETATGGETILIAPGSYTELGSDGIGHTVGFYINTPNLTLQGVQADGSLIATAEEARDLGATIISGHQTGFGANHWVDVNGDGTAIQGLHLQAGPETTNKVLEIRPPTWLRPAPILLTRCCCPALRMTNCSRLPTRSWMPWTMPATARSCSRTAMSISRRTASSRRGRPRRACSERSIPPTPATLSMSARAPMRAPQPRR